MDYHGNVTLNASLTVIKITCRKSANCAKKRDDDLDSRAFARNKVQPDGEEKAISQFAIDHSSQRRKSNRMHQMHQSVEQTRAK